MQTAVVEINLNYVFFNTKQRVGSNRSVATICCHYFLFCKLPNVNIIDDSANLRQRIGRVPQLEATAVSSPKTFCH